MRYRIILSMFIILFIISSSIIPPLLAESNDEIEVQSENNQYSKLDKILLKIYNSTKGLTGIVPWAPPLIAIPPITFEAEPGEISIGYLDSTEIFIGEKNKTTGDWAEIEDLIFPTIFPKEEYIFELVLLENLSYNIFKGRFKPEIIRVGTEGVKRTSLTIETSIPEDQPLPKSITIWVKVTKYVTGQNVFFNPNAPIYSIKGIFWFLAATGVIGNNPFGFLYSGKRVVDAELLIPILVKFDRFHELVLEPTESVELKPDEITSIPIKVTNYGTQIDTYSFRVNQEKDNGDIKISPPSSITLEPLETGYTYLGVSSPRIFQDPGTARTINIQAYSIYDENKSFNNSVTIVTQGFYVSETGLSYFFLLLFFILIIAIFYYYRKKHLRQKICKRPEKPWNILEEKKHLDKLKEKDPEKYSKELDMMKQEYKSSLLWYKNYCSYEENKNKNLSKIKTKKIVKKQKIKEKEKPETKKGKNKKEIKQKEEIKELPEEKTVEEIEEMPEFTETKNESIIKKPKPKVDKKKQKELDKIRKKQEKQKRNLK